MKSIYIFLSLLIAFAWGIIPSIQKYALHSLPVITVFAIGSVVYFIGAMIFITYYRKEVVTSLSTIDLKVFGLLVFSGFFCALLPNLLFIKILKHNSSYILTALSYTSPVFTLLLSYLWLKEEITLHQVFGILLIIIGVILVAYNKNESFVNTEHSELYIL